MDFRWIWLSRHFPRGWRASLCRTRFFYIEWDVSSAILLITVALNAINTGMCWCSLFKYSILMNFHLLPTSGEGVHFEQSVVFLLTVPSLEWRSRCCWKCYTLLKLLYGGISGAQSGDVHTRNTISLAQNQTLWHRRCFQTQLCTKRQEIFVLRLNETWKVVKEESMGLSKR